MSRFTANSLLILAAMIWGGGFVSQSVAMANIGPLWFTGLRFLIAALAMLPLALAERRRATYRFDRTDRRLILWISLAFFGGSVLQQIALVTSSVTNVAFLTTLYIVFVPLLALSVQGERPGAALTLAVTLALAGIWMLSGGVYALGAGDLLAIASAACFAIQIMLLNIATRRSGLPATIALVEMLFTALLTCGWALVAEPLDLKALAGIVPELLYAGVFSGGLAFMLQAIGQRYARAGDAALLLSSEGLFGMIFAVLLIGERPSLLALSGGALILISVLIVQFAPPPKHGRKQE